MGGRVDAVESPPCTSRRVGGGRGLQASLQLHPRAKARRGRARMGSAAPKGQGKKGGWGQQASLQLQKQSLARLAWLAWRVWQQQQHQQQLAIGMAGMADRSSGGQRWPGLAWLA